MPQVFISHCTQDADFAQRIAARLGEAGIEVWIAPNSIRPGETFVDAIERGLDSTTHFVLVMSPDAFESNWVKLEMNTAIRLEREGRLAISPILYRACKAPLLLGNFQWIEHHGDERAVAQRLLKWIGAQGAAGQDSGLHWSAPREMSEERLVEIMAGLSEIANEAAVCTLCSLHQGRIHAVPGNGSPGARLMFIGEAPGPQDDLTGEAFVSPAGEFLDELLTLISVRREDVFMTNVVKCRPNPQRKPEPDEIKTCCDTYLDRQIALIDPPVIVSMGTYALSRIAPRMRLSVVHGIPKPLGGRLLFPMYHPAAAMYQGKYRNMLVDDFQAMAKHLAQQPV